MNSVEQRVEIRPAGPFRLPGGGMDGVLRRRGDVLERLLHHAGEPVLVRAAQTAPDRVMLGARAATREATAYGIERMRFALGVDEDLSAFHRRFVDDPLIGRSVRRRPWLRASRRPEPFEALAWAVCEQLIEYERAAAIERRLLARLGRRWIGWDGSASPLRDLPTPAELAGTAPALLESFDLAGKRALTLVRAAREVALGRVDLHATRARAQLAPAACDPRDRALDGRDARAARPGSPRSGAGRRRRAAQARRAAAQRRRSVRARAGARGARVLRPLRGVGGAGGGAHCSRSERASGAAPVAR